MPHNKNQHYVPKFYFKLFSKSSHINIYNLKNKGHFFGSIKGQASKDYFYGKNLEIEKQFSSLEFNFKKNLEKLNKVERFKELDSEEYMEILRFITFQSERTELSKTKTKQATQQMVEMIMKPLMKSDKNLMKKVSPEDIDKLKISNPSDFLYSILLSLISNILLSDLIPAILINETDKDFIFSDNPIVLYNPIYDNGNNSFRGFQSPALLVFCPISSKKCLMLFDPEYYDITLDKNNFHSITDSKDISKINKLQFYNCLYNIYYENQNQKGEVDSLSKDFFSKYKKEEQLALTKTAKNTKDPNRELVIFSSKGIPEKILFSFLKYGKIKTRTSLMRNQKICDLFNEKANSLIKKET